MRSVVPDLGSEQHRRYVYTNMTFTAPYNKHTSIPVVHTHLDVLANVYYLQMYTYTPLGHLKIYGCTYILYMYILYTCYILHVRPLLHLAHIATPTYCDDDLMMSSVSRFLGLGKATFMDKSKMIMMMMMMMDDDDDGCVVVMMVVVMMMIILMVVVVMMVHGDDVGGSDDDDVWWW